MIRQSEVAPNTEQEQEEEGSEDSDDDDAEEVGEEEEEDQEQDEEEVNNEKVGYCILFLFLPTPPCQLQPESRLSIFTTPLHIFISIKIFIFRCQ